MKKNVCLYIHVLYYPGSTCESKIRQGLQNSKTVKQRESQRMLIDTINDKNNATEQKIVS